MKSSLNIEKIEKLNPENQAYIAGVIDALVATNSAEQEETKAEQQSPDKPR